MKYLEVGICTSDAGIDYITAMLSDLEIYETVVESKETAVEVLNKKADFAWDYVDEKAFDDDGYADGESKITFYIEYGSQGDKLLERVFDEMGKVKRLKDRNELRMDLGSLIMEVSEVDDENWIRAYKETLEPIFLTDEIVIKPSWIDIGELSDEKTVISLDPGMAFGTGDHETTAMCGMLMEKYGCESKKILDIGTGSGILAIVGAKLGATEIKAIDIDEVAVEVAKENVILNACEDVVSVSVGDLTKGIEYKADIVVANLMAELVVFLSEAVREHMREDGLFITSGILLEKEDMVKEGMVVNGLEIVEVVCRGEWCAIVAKPSRKTEKM